MKKQIMPIPNRVMCPFCNAHHPTLRAKSKSNPEVFQIFISCQKTGKKVILGLIDTTIFQMKIINGVFKIDKVEEFSKVQEKIKEKYGNLLRSR